MHEGDTPPGRKPKGIDEEWWNATWKRLREVHTVAELRDELRNQPEVIANNWNHALYYFSENPYWTWRDRIQLGYRGKLTESRVIPDRCVMAIMLWLERFAHVSPGEWEDLLKRFPNAYPGDMLNAFMRLVSYRFMEWSQPEVNDNEDAIGYGSFPRRPPFSRVRG